MSVWSLVIVLALTYGIMFTRLVLLPEMQKMDMVRRED